MPVTGRFLADFQSFYAAVQKAEVELRGMETGAGKVSTSLNRMADSFSGRKLISEATLAAEAVERIGGASKLTEAEQANVNRTVAEAIAKYKVLGKDAPKALLDLEQATRKLHESTTRTWADIGASMQKFGQGAKTIGFGLTAAITAPILGIAGAAVKLGIDAVESENLVAVSFGSMKGNADAWSKKLSQSVGLNEFELRKQAGTLFNMTTSMGLTKDAAFSMSTGVAKLAADMASFRNIPMEEAFNKIKTGLTGETEPLKAIGILVDDATIKTYAYTHGLAKQGSELTQQQKVMARWGSILQQTANDQGDLERTITSPANQLRILKTRIEEAGTALGVALMPMIEATVGWLVKIGPVIQDAVAFFAGLPMPVKLATVAFAGLAAAAGPVLLALGTVTSALGPLVAMLGTGGLTGALAVVGPVLGTAGAALAAITLPLATLGGALLYTVVRTTALREDFKKLEDASRLTGKAILDVGVAAAVLDAYEAGKRGEKIADNKITMDMAKAYMAGHDAVMKAAEAAQKNATAVEQTRSAMSGAAVTIGGFAQAVVSATDPLAGLKAQALALKNDAIAPLSAEHTKLILTFAKGGESATDIAKRFAAVGATANIGEQAIKNTIDAHKKSATASNAHAKALDGVAASYLSLSESQKASVAQMLAHGNSVATIAKALQLAEVQVKNFADAQKDAAKQADNWAKLNDKLNDENAKGFKKVLDAKLAVNKQTLDADLVAWIAQTETTRTYTEKNLQLTLAGGALRVRQIEVEHKAAIAALRQKGDTETAEYARAKAQIDQFYEHQTDLAKGTYATIVERMSAAGVKTIAQSKEVELAFQRDYAQMLRTGLYSTEELGAAWDRANKTAIDATNKTAVAIESLGHFIGQIGSLSGGAFGTILGEVGKLVGAFGQAEKAALAYRKAIETKDTGAQTQAIAGGLLSSVSIFMTLKGYMDAADAANHRLFETRKAAIDAAGGINQLALQAKMAGINLNVAFGDFTGTATTTANLRKHIAELNEVMGRAGLTWRDLGVEIRQANIDEAARQIASDFRLLTLRGFDSDAMIRGMSGSLNQLVVDAVKTGTRIPAAMQPILEKLIRMGKLTDEAARAMLGLAADTMPSIEDITAAAGRYGLTLDDLGQKVQQLRITNLSGQIVKDFNLLILAGADVGVVMLSMKDQVQKLVTQALALGLALPESMRPLIEQMIAAGLLTDEFGNALKDTGKINFAADLTKKIDELISKLGELIDQWNKVGEAAEIAGSRSSGGLPTTGTAIPRASASGEALVLPGRSSGDRGVGRTGTGVTQTIVVQLGTEVMLKTVAEGLPGYLKIHGAA